MTRAEKYPDNKYYKYVNVNSHNRKGGDCVIRAIAYALGQSWEQTVMEMTEVGLKKGYVVNDDKTIEMYLTQKGWVKNSQPRHRDNTKYTVAQFVKKFNTGVMIIRMAGHVSVVDNGVNIDIWDCVKHGGTVGNYWTFGGK